MWVKTILLSMVLSGYAVFSHADLLLGLPSLNMPADNPQTEQKIALGRTLFHDKRFSGDGHISCASCHDEAKAFSDGLPVAQGIANQSGLRNAPTVLNAAYYDAFFHDGRASSLEQQALDPFTNPIEHGLKSYQEIVQIIVNDASYRQQFTDVFSVATDRITINHVVKAIAAFERTLLSANSPFDQYYFGGKRQAISESAARGIRLFRRKGNCANCHEISWNNALFMDNRYYNLGVGFKALEPVLEELLTGVDNGQPLASMALSEKQRSELGRYAVTGNKQDIGKFKTPSLRNIALTAPYMHDGSMQTLREVIDYYDKGGHANPFLDPAIFPLKLTEQEKLDLLEFLKTLNGNP